MTTAEGGMITTYNDMLARRIRNMRSHGMTSTTYDRHQGHAFSYDVIELGYNYRIDELRSALGLAQLGKLTHWNTQRKRLCDRYRKLLSSIDAIILPFLETNGESVNHIFPVLLKEDERRQEFMAYLKTHGIQTSIHYPAVHLFDYYRRSYGCRTGMLPKTEQVANREVTLPLYPDMKTDDVEYIGSIIKKFFK